MRFQGFIGPSYQMQSVNVDCQRCINLYPELNEIGTGKEKEVASLVATPGLSLLATVGSGPIRGEWRATNGTLYVVSGNALYSVSSSWAATSLGTLLTDSGSVGMADNGLQLVIVDGDNGYSFTFASSTFAQITGDGWRGSNTVTYIDGYFIFVEPDSGTFYISGLNDITLDPLDITQAEGSPDNLVAQAAVHRDLWLFGDSSTEIFYNTGDADQPFQRVQGGFLEIGCAAAFSVAEMNNTVFWLGQDDKGSGIVYMANGYTPTRISTHAVELAIQGYGDISDAVAYTYQASGHSFYVLNFTSADTTWVYDSTTSHWHERVYTNQGQFERHRANCHAFAYSTHVVGDYVNGNIYALSSSKFSDNGSEITRRRVAPHVSSDLMRVFYNSFQLDIESGTGIDGTGQGTDPQVMLEWSDDGGHTWSNEKWTSFGKIGQTKRRALWRRLGSSRDRVFRVTITDPVKITLIGATLQVDQGAS